jgi:hypothetical protein
MLKLTTAVNSLFKPNEKKWVSLKHGKKQRKKLFRRKFRLLVNGNFRFLVRGGIKHGIPLTKKRKNEK